MRNFYSFYWFQSLFIGFYSPIKFLPHPTSFIYGHKVHGQSFYWIKLLCHYQKIFIFQFNVYFTEDHWQRERKRVQRKRIWFKCIFLTNTIFSLRIKNGYLDVSGWWNLVQFRRWWEWAEDRILIWTFKTRFTLPMLAVDSGGRAAVMTSLGKFYWELLNCLRINVWRNYHCLVFIYKDEDEVF